VTVSPDQTATYTATYTNDCGETSTHEFTVSVEGDAGTDGPGWPDHATDPDGDGLYEDVNGNGEVDYSDVIEYFNHMDSEAMQDQVEYFDYNGNGEIDFADLVDLFQQV